jgi:hypothetical protein
MTKFDNVLDNVRVASPCSVDWNEMIGDNRRRFCGDCKLNVYNLSGMTRTDAENLILTAEGRLCVKFYRRADGSILTQDCPVGWARAKQRTKLFVTAAASLLFTFFGAIGLVGVLGKSKLIGKVFPISLIKPTPERTMGIMMPPRTPTPSPTATPKKIMGKIAVPKKEQTEMRMGDVNN